MITKTVTDFEVKLAEDGIVEGIASRYGVLDSDGETVDPFAFADSLKENRGIVPILAGHDRNQPIGWGMTAHESRDGLHVRGKLIMSGKGKEMFDLIKTGLSVGASPNLSIGFTVPPGGSYTKSEGGRSVRHFKQVDLKEWSVVSFGACPGAVLTAAKDEKAGQVLSAANRHKLGLAMEHIQTGMGHLKELLSAYGANDVNEPNPVGGKSFIESAQAKLLLEEIDAYLAKMTF